ncbi:hypothetical protein EDD18DRAFT_1114193 [Armillaria luteobubalina]|uniref:Uncharacterized protein n=1 Tax=Armillaria luteobubalina TaxID=153913 RepID=A0AA39U9W9_9AGAR|nr:hypothetical protein EDD18DRAFT_1114193 [Armillaria luteobubalina]
MQHSPTDAYSLTTILLLPPPPDSHVQSHKSNRATPISASEWVVPEMPVTPQQPEGGMSTKVPKQARPTDACPTTTILRSPPSPDSHVWSHDSNHAIPTSASESVLEVPVTPQQPEGGTSTEVPKQSRPTDACPTTAILPHPPSPNSRLQSYEHNHVAQAPTEFRFLFSQLEGEVSVKFDMSPRPIDARSPMTTVPTVSCPPSPDSHSDPKRALVPPCPGVPPIEMSSFPNWNGESSTSGQDLSLA